MEGDAVGDVDFADEADVQHAAAAAVGVGVNFRRAGRHRKQRVFSAKEKEIQEELWRASKEQRQKVKLQEARRQQRLQALAAARAAAKHRATAKKSRAEEKKKKAAASRLAAAAAAAAAATRIAAENAAEIITETATGVQAAGDRQNGAGGDQGSMAVVMGLGGTDRAYSLLAHTLERGNTRRRRVANKKYVQEVSLTLNQQTTHVSVCEHHNPKPFECNSALSGG